MGKDRYPRIRLSPNRSYPIIAGASDMVPESDVIQGRNHYNHAHDNRYLFGEAFANYLSTLGRFGGYGIDGDVTVTSSTIWNASQRVCQANRLLISNNAVLTGVGPYLMFLCRKEFKMVGTGRVSLTGADGTAGGSGGAGGVGKGGDGGLGLGSGLPGSVYSTSWPDITVNWTATSAVGQSPGGLLAFTGVVKNLAGGGGGGGTDNTSKNPGGGGGPFGGTGANYGNGGNAWNWGGTANLAQKHLLDLRDPTIFAGFRVLFPEWMGGHKGWGGGGGGGADDNQGHGGGGGGGGGAIYIEAPVVTIPGQVGGGFMYDFDVHGGIGAAKRGGSGGGGTVFIVCKELNVTNGQSFVNCCNVSRGSVAVIGADFEGGRQGGNGTAIAIILPSY